MLPVVAIVRTHSFSAKIIITVSYAFLRKYVSTLVHVEESDSSCSDILPRFKCYYDTLPHLSATTGCLFTLLSNEELEQIIRNFLVDLDMHPVLIWLEY